MINLKMAFMAPFQEKGAVSKIGFFAGTWFIALVAIFVPAFMLGLLDSAGSGGFAESASALGSILFCVVYILALGFALIVSMWYMYEYMSAYSQGRETNMILNEGMGTVLKKVGKLLLVSFVYGIPIIILVICAYILLFVVLFGGGIATASLTANSLDSGSSLGAGGIGIGMILMLCFGVIAFFLLVMLYSYYIVNPALFRLTYTNTFGKAFDFSGNWKYAMANKKNIFLLILVQIVIMIVFTVLQWVFSFLSAFIIGIPFLIITYVIYFYYTYLAQYVLLGNFYRHTRLEK